MVESTAVAPARRVCLAALLLATALAMTAAGDGPHGRVPGPPAQDVPGCPRERGWPLLACARPGLCCSLAG